MAAKVNRGQPQSDPKVNPNSCVSVRVHESTRVLAQKVCKRLEEQARAGMKVPVRFDLGPIHIFDEAVARLAREVGVT